MQSFIHIGWASSSSLPNEYVSFHCLTTVQGATGPFLLLRVLAPDSRRAHQAGPYGGRTALPSRPFAKETKRQTSTFSFNAENIIQTLGSLGWEVVGGIHGAARWEETYPVRFPGGGRSPGGPLGVGTQGAMVPTLGPLGGLVSKAGFPVSV